MRYVIPVEAAREAAGQVPIIEALDTLIASGLIQSYRIIGGDLIVEADAGVEAAFIMAAQVADTARPAGTLHTPAATGSSGRQDYADTVHSTDAGRLRAETSAVYYSQAEAFTRTAAFRKLPERRRAVWRLHAQGLTKYEIAERLGCPSGAVARAVLAIRPKAGLRRTSRTISRGRQGKRNIT